MRRNHPERIDHKRLSRPDRQYELHRDGLPLRMSDGVRLSADLYLPSGPGPWPVLLERTPYNKEASVEVIQVGSPAYFASRGYARGDPGHARPVQLGGGVLPVSRRRLGRSEDRDRVYDTVESIAKQQDGAMAKSARLGGLIRRAHPVRPWRPLPHPTWRPSSCATPSTTFTTAGYSVAVHSSSQFNLDWALVQSVSQVEPGDCRRCGTFTAQEGDRRCAGTAVGMVRVPAAARNTGPAGDRALVLRLA